MPDLSGTERPFLERTSTGIRVVQPPMPEPTAEEIREKQLMRYPQTEKLRAKLEAELAAGKAAVAAAAERRRLNPPPKPTDKEVAAQGSTTPVFRPADFVEYAKNFAKPERTRSKDQ